MRFAGNGIDDEGVKQLVKSLENNTTLTSLDLAGTRWCSVTSAFVCICIHICECYTTMQSSAKPGLHPSRHFAPYANANVYTNANPAANPKGIPTHIYTQQLTLLCVYVYVCPSLCLALFRYRSLSLSLSLSLPLSVCVCVQMID